MINNVILAGRFNGFDGDNKILLKMESLENHQIGKINIPYDLKDKIVNFIKENDVIGVKGYVEIDNIHNIIIVATKISFISSSQTKGSE